MSWKITVTKWSSLVIAYKIDTCIKFELYEEKVMKVLKKIWVPVLIAIILIAFGGAVYYQKAVVPKKEIDKKAGITSGKLDDYITLGEYKGLSCEVTQDDSTTKTAPINALTTHSHSVLFAFSLSTKYDIIMAKNGDNLFRILASAMGHAVK